MAAAIPEYKAPIVMRIFMWIAAFYAMWLVARFGFAVDGYGITVGGGNTYLDSALWLRLLGPLCVIKAVMLSAISYGIYNQKRWSRHLVPALGLIVAIYACAVIYPAGYLGRQFRSEIIQALILGPLAALYFYVTPGVARYFGRLNRSESLE